MRRLGAILAAALVLAAAAAAHAAGSPALEAYFGSYVGRAVERDSAGEVREERDIDIVIRPYKQGGFEIEWVNVTLVGGRRDVPGVKRRPAASLFVPSEDRDFFVESPGFNPFKLREDVTAMEGGAVRWAALDENGLHVYAFVVLEDGRYEMATYTRRLNETGIELEFERVVDGLPVRRLTGRAVRAD
jgi:hypothetical protein